MAQNKRKHDQLFDSLEADFIDVHLLTKYPYLIGKRSDLAPVNSFGEMMLILEIMDVSDE